MDIAYLLLLQNFREGVGGFLTPAMEFITKLAVSPVIFWLIACLYWVFDKRAGGFIVLSFAVSNFFNQILKLSVCAYRPWIRDGRIVPAGDAIVAATGYSFPSGHTQTAASLYGATAISYGKKRKWLFIVLLVLILLTGFSRNFLGVHTPQDVLVAMLGSALLLFIASRVRTALEKKPSLDIRFTALGILAAVLALAYISFKPYPMDYVNGKLLVDPVKMMEDAFEAVGMLCGMLLGWLIERRRIRFENDPKNPLSYVIAGLAALPMLYFRSMLPKELAPLCGANLGGLLGNLLLGVFTFAFVPFVIKRVGSARQKKKNSNQTV